MESRLLHVQRDALSVHKVFTFSAVEVLSTLVVVLRSGSTRASRLRLTYSADSSGSTTNEWWVCTCALRSTKASPVGYLKARMTRKGSSSSIPRITSYPQARVLRTQGQCIFTAVYGGKLPREREGSGTGASDEYSTHGIFEMPVVSLSLALLSLGSALEPRTEWEHGNQICGTKNRPQKSVTKPTSIMFYYEIRGARVCLSMAHIPTMTDELIAPMSFSK